LFSWDPSIYLRLLLDELIRRQICLDFFVGFFLFDILFDIELVNSVPNRNVMGQRHVWILTAQLLEHPQSIFSELVGGTFLQTKTYVTLTFSFNLG
jgi:hypothetical protein